MRTRIISAWDPVRIAIAGIVILFSTLAMSSTKTSPTPTIVASATNTELPTTTSTATPTITTTFTPSPSPTPAYLSAQAIQTIQSNLETINAKLDGISKKTEPADLSNILDDLIANGLWAILIALESILGTAILVVWGKSKQDEERGKSPRSSYLTRSLIFGLILILIMLIAYFTIPILIFIGQTNIQTSDQMQLNSISQQLDHVETRLNTQPQATPSLLPSPIHPSNLNTTNNLDWLIPTAISSGLLLLFLGAAVVIAGNQTKFYEIESSKIEWQELGTKLLPAGFLVLILYLLPSPIDTFLMPILVPFFIVAFFNVVILYPNQHLKRLVIKHYSMIIFIAVFGVWYGVFQRIQEYSYPIWDTANGIFRSNIEATANNQFLNGLPQLMWGVLPLALSIVFSLAPWRTNSKHLEREIHFQTGRLL